MKSVSSAKAAALLVLLAGCRSDTGVWTERDGDVDTAIQIEIAVRSQPYEPGDGINEGNFLVVSSNVVPINSTGGPGRVVSDRDGVTVELQWDDVRLLQSRISQHRLPEIQISFDNLRFNLANQLVRQDGVAHHLRFGPGSQSLSSTFDLVCSPLTFSSGADDEERTLVVRARLLPEPHSAKPLSIPRGNAG